MCGGWQVTAISTATSIHYTLGTVSTNIYVDVYHSSVWKTAHIAILSLDYHFVFIESQTSLFNDFLLDQFGVTFGVCRDRPEVVAGIFYLRD
jgi:hypothetical protein